MDWDKNSLISEIKGARAEKKTKRKHPSDGKTIIQHLPPKDQFLAILQAMAALERLHPTFIAEQDII